MFQSKKSVKNQFQFQQKYYFFSIDFLVVQGDLTVIKFEIPLNIPDIEIIQSEIDKCDDHVITIKSTKKGTPCYKCGNTTTKIHGYDDPILIRHLPILGNRVYLKISPARYQCLLCDDHPTTTESLSWYNKKSSYTKDYENHILLQVINSTIQDVSIKEDIQYQSVVGIVDRRIQSKVDWTKYESIDELGLDEISLRKGHKDFVVIVTARNDGKNTILGVLKDRKKETVKEFLQTIPKELVDTIKCACCDMYDGFINAVKETLGNKVKVVVDRFHVAKHYRNCIEKLRKQELRRLKKSLAEDEYKKLKGAMWALRKSNLTEKEQVILKLLFEYSPQLKIIYDLQNELTQIFDSKISREDAVEKIKDWIKCIRENNVKDFDAFLITLENSWEEILNYFENRSNSGFVEGLNNKIKVLKRRCYGIFNLKHLFQRMYLDFSGYEEVFE